MQLTKVYIQGFRNFKEVTVNFNEHCLLIGANDVGKTNLIQAMRILLDRSFSDYDFELNETDYYAYDNTSEILIRAYFCNVTEDCIVARLGDKLSDDGDLVLQYKANLINGRTDYQFACGKSDDKDDLKDVDSPYWRKYLNIKYISSRREFWRYINKTKNELLQQAKLERTPEVVEDDERLYSDIETKLNEIDLQVPQLSYVKNATQQLNAELNKLSVHNVEQEIVFDTSSTDIDRVINNVSVVSKFKDRKMIVGGEGRINQIYLSLWASQNQNSDISNEVSIICIEEPEAYLHPHQQRKLANYLNSTLNGQVILTSHSPFIVEEFSPNSIIRLYKRKSNDTKVASDGCSKVIAKGFEDFGYRMSVIPAEAFFSDFAVLVEGPSELMFYKTLAKQIDIDVDRLNVSILDVGGVGFSTYIKILDALCIDWVLRTDNDIFKIPNKSTYRFAGIERGLDFFEQSFNIDDKLAKKIEQDSILIHGFDNRNNIQKDVKEAANRLVSILKANNILIAITDLETDLYESPLQDSLREYYGKDLTKEQVIEEMKAHKAINMFDYLKKKKADLKLLADDNISEPLKIAENYIATQYGTY